MSLEQTIQDLVSKYSSGLSNVGSSKQTDKSERDEDKHVVLLTGTTGRLGAEILVRLLAEPRAQRIYAYNRPSVDGSTLESRHYTRFEDKGFDVDLLRDPRVVYLEADMYHEKLGLADSQYEELLDTLTTIIHTAWDTDLYLPLGAFEPQIAGMHNLIQLGLASKHHPQFLFLSSALSAQSWDPTARVFPENEIVDTRYAEGTGLGEAKYVAEVLLAHSGLESTSIRLEQVCGSEPSGACAMSDWLPVMVKTSLMMEVFPLIPGFRLRWLPSSTVAGIVCDIAFSSKDQELPISVNAVHPRPIPWEAFATSLQTVLAEQGKPEFSLVPWSEWMEELVLNQRLGISKGLPALEIMEYFLVLDGLFTNASPSLAYESTLAQRLSLSLRDVQPLNEADVRLWVDYWVKHGL